MVGFFFPSFMSPLFLNPRVGHEFLLNEFEPDGLHEPRSVDLSVATFLVPDAEKFPLGPKNAAATEKVRERAAIVKQSRARNQISQLLEKRIIAFRKKFITAK